ncbi:unnamed protein product [Closterium sp. NIES-53]
MAARATHQEQHIMELQQTISCLESRGGRETSPTAARLTTRQSRAREPVRDVRAALRHHVNEIADYVEGTPTVARLPMVEAALEREVRNANTDGEVTPGLDILGRPLGGWQQAHSVSGAHSGVVEDSGNILTYDTDVAEMNSWVPPDLAERVVARALKITHPDHLALLHMVMTNDEKRSGWFTRHMQVWRNTKWEQGRAFVNILHGLPYKAGANPRIRLPRRPRVQDVPRIICIEFTKKFEGAQALYDAVVARYSSPAIAALGRLLLPYLFPELSAFATVEDLVFHLRTSNARYRAAALAEGALPPPLPPPTPLLLLLKSLMLRTSGLLLLARSTTVARARVAGVVAVAAGVVVGAPVEVVEAMEVVAAVGMVVGVGDLVVVVEAAVGVEVVAAVGVVAVGLELSVEVLEEARGSGSRVGARSHRPNSFVERPHGAELLRSGVPIFDQDYDAILSAMYALSVSAEGDCYLCVPPDPGIEAAALGASESSILGTAPAKALDTFTLDSGASRCFFRVNTALTPLPAPVLVRLADPSGGPVVAHSSTVLPCPAVPSGSLSGLHLPSFSTNFVSTTALQDAIVTTTTLGGQRVSICTCTQTGRHLATFTRRPGSSKYTLATKPPHVATSAQVPTSGQVAPPCSCRLLSHQTLLWHHRLGHPSLPRLRGMHSRLLVSGLPRSLPPLPPSPAPPCLPCAEGRQRAAPCQTYML